MVTLTCGKETNDVCIYMGVRVCIRSNDEYYTLGLLFMWCSRNLTLIQNKIHIIETNLNKLVHHMIQRLELETVHISYKNQHKPNI